MKGMFFLGAVGIIASVMAPGARAAVSAAELSGFKKRLAPVRTSFAADLKDYQKDLEEAKDALEVDKVKLAARPRQVAYLRFLLMLEEDLRLLASPEDKVDESIEVRELSSQEKKKVVALRQEIRDAERERVREELKEGRGMRSDEKTEKAIYKDEMSLDSVFDRNISKLKRDIEKAQRDLSKEKYSDDGDERKVEALEKQLEDWEGQIATMHRYVYGFEPGIGFETKADPADSSDAGKFLADLVTERDKVLQILRGEEQGGEGEKKGGVVGGSFLYSSNLGVVLDVSGSMTPHIEKLKEEIAGTFEAPRYREVKGCAIGGRRYGELDLARMAGTQADTMLVIEDLVSVYGVDTVYWFCDLQDGYDFAGLRRLRALLLRGGGAFHVKSVGRRPERELKPLIDDFQG